MQRSTSAPAKSFFQPIDRVAIVLMLILSLIIGGVLLRGGSVAPRVREFNWQDRQVGAEDTAFILTFSRPMDYASVEQNLRIDPPLPGKISWAGRRMAYTLTAPAPYGNLYQVQLQGARDRFSPANSEQSTFQPFLGRFQSRDRSFAYIGVQGEEEGRLVLYNFTQKQKRILTPKNLVVMEFEPYPLSDRILFSATERTDKPQNGLSQQLYTVTTGIAVHPPEATDAQPNLFNWRRAEAPRPEEAGQVNLILDGKHYQNLKFDLSDDGNTIVVQRVSLKDPADSGPWLLRAETEPQPLKGQPGGDFLLTPDSNSLAIAQGQGLAILPLEPDAKPLDFLPKFGMVLGFAKDGTAAAMVKFNNDYTRSLFLVNIQGTQKELLRTTGSILSAQFDPTKQRLYCLLTNLIPGETYQEEPFLATIDLKTAKLQPLLRLPNQQDLQISLSPDGLAVLFDQTVDTRAEEEADTPKNKAGKAIVDSRLWVLPLVPLDENSVKVQPELLPLSGIRPRWLP